MGEPDASLVGRALSGQAEAYEGLWRAHAGRVTAYFLRSGFGQADADDLAQESFARAFRSLATFDPQKGPFGGWLSAIARNVARRYWSERKEADHFDAELADDVLGVEANPGMEAAAREEVEALRQCIAALPGELSRLVRLRYVDGRTTRGVAAAAEMPEATVRLRLGEAHEQLLRCLKGKGVLA